MGGTAIHEDIVGDHSIGAVVNTADIAGVIDYVVDEREVVLVSVIKDHGVVSFDILEDVIPEGDMMEIVSPLGFFG